MTHRTTRSQAAGQLHQAKTAVGVMPIFSKVPLSTLHLPERLGEARREFNELVESKRGTALKPVHSPSRQAGAEYRRQRACLLTESIVSNRCSARIGVLLDPCPEVTLPLHHSR